MGSLGRPVILNIDPDMVIKLCSYLSKGMFLKEACSLTGIHRDTAYEYMKQGVRDRRAGRDTPMARFSDAVEIAMATAESNALENINAAGRMPAHWTASAWFLERRYPEKYGRKDRVALEHSGGVGIGVAMVHVNLDEIDTEAANAIAANLTIISGESRGAIGAGEGDEPSHEDPTPFVVPEWEVDPNSTA